MTLRHRKQPGVSVQLRLNTVDETVSEIRFKSETNFSLRVGDSAPVELEAVLSDGSVIPHLEYSSDLELLQGTEFAYFEDGQGLVGLRPTPGRISITGGIAGQNAVASATLEVLEAPDQPRKTPPVRP